MSKYTLPAMHTPKRMRCIFLKRKNRHTQNKADVVKLISGKVQFKIKPPQRVKMVI